MDYMVPDVLKKAVKLNHSLTRESGMELDEAVQIFKLQGIFPFGQFIDK